MKLTLASIVVALVALGTAGAAHACGYAYGYATPYATPYAYSGGYYGRGYYGGVGIYGHGRRVARRVNRRHGNWD